MPSAERPPPQPPVIKPVDGRLGVLTVGMGAVATTFIAGVELAKRGMAAPIGSLTQMGTIRLGKRTDHRVPLINDFVPIASLDDLVFGAGIRSPTTPTLPRSARVCSSRRHLEPIAEALRDVRPMKAAFDPCYVKRLDGPNVKEGVEQASDARRSPRRHPHLRRAASARSPRDGLVRLDRDLPRAGAAHQDIASFERAIDANDPTIAPSMLYAYAALLEGIPFANGAPNLTVDIPALERYAADHKIPICGKDFKTGQTLLKTVLAPMFKARMLGVAGWYSTNILGNRDGEVLDDPESFKTKEESKLGVLEHILEPERYPAALRRHLPQGPHQLLPAARRQQRGLGQHRHLRVARTTRCRSRSTFLCRDSILAAPLALDLALFSDLAQRAGMGGIQEWLSFYFKSPQVAAGLYPEHDLFIQLTKLKNTLRWMMGEDRSRISASSTTSTSSAQSRRRRRSSACAASLLAATNSLST